MFCLNMLSIAMELTRRDPSYEDMCTKFFEHFVYIAHAMNTMGTADMDLYDDEDGFYYDVLHRPDGSHEFLRVRSMVGLIPLLAVDTMDEAQYRRPARFPAARRVVHRQPAPACQKCRRPVRDGPSRPPPAFHCRPGSPADHSDPDAGRDRVSCPRTASAPSPASTKTTRS